MGDRVGQQLGNYRLLRIIGQGSFADVYLGEHIHLHTQAAIKILQMRLVENNVENFLNEARTIAHFVHPYIIRVLDFGVQDSVPFLVMDYAPKGTFRQRFLQGKPLPPAPLASFMRQTAAALQYAHDRKLIHRDVKPENMLLGPNDEVLLSDFGFALVAQSASTSSLAETAGTATYMAPEQFQGKPRPASDQYSLGIIAYEWLTGTLPFDGSFFEIASQQVLAPPPLLREKVPTIAREIERVVMTALAKDPQKRYTNVRDFALALSEACLSAKEFGFDLPTVGIAEEASFQVPVIKTISPHDTPSMANRSLSGQSVSPVFPGYVPPELSPASPTKKSPFAEWPLPPKISLDASSLHPVPASQEERQTVNWDIEQTVAPVENQAKNQSSMNFPSLQQYPSLSNIPVSSTKSSLDGIQIIRPDQFENAIKPPDSAQRAAIDHPAKPGSSSPTFTRSQVSQSNIPTLSSQVSQSNIPIMRSQASQSNIPTISSQSSQSNIPVTKKQSAASDVNLSSTMQPVESIKPEVFPQQPGTFPGRTTRNLTQSAQMRSLGEPSTVQKSSSPTGLERDAAALRADFTKPYLSRMQGSASINRIALFALILFIIVGSSVGILYWAIAQQANANVNTALHQQIDTKATAKALTIQKGSTVTAQAVVANATATATSLMNQNPYPPNTGVLVLNDALANNQYHNWNESNDPGAPACQFQPDGYHVIAPRTLASACFASATSYGDFAYEVQMSFLKIGTTYSSGGIIFRGNTTTNQYYRFEIYESGKYRLATCISAGDNCITVVDGTLKAIAPIPSFNTALNQPNTLAVVAAGKTFTIYVNGKAAFDPFTDENSALTNGVIGVFAHGGSDRAPAGDADVLFSKVRVWKL